MSRPPNGGGYRNMSNGSNPALSSGPPAAMSSQSRLNTPSQTQLHRPASSTAQSRAERFEDEKRRIIESCFSKLDANGQLSESYITHIRITEDASYPSTPAPPDTPAGNKKPRLIIIAVRSTGRVRMHKARENNNGSFSIGKTWNLEELSSIESFSNTGVPPRDERERQYRSWAGNVGFVVTISKPYYWQAGTAKEKDFFIASAVKIYRKYTKGMVPELKGFEEREKNSILGAAPTQQQPPQGPPPEGSRAVSDNNDPAPPQPPFAARGDGREESRYRGSPGPPGSSAGSRVESPARGPPGMQQYRQGQPPPGPRPFASAEQMRSGSREHSRPGSRPDTAPGPRGSPHSGAPHMPGQFPPGQQPSQSHLRSDSPGMAAGSAGRDPSLPRNAPPRQQSPPRQRSFQQSVHSVPEDQPYEQKPPPAAGAASGASLLAATRQRWAQQQQQQQQPEERVASRGQPAPQRQQSGSELPPLETATSRQQSNDRIPQSAQSHASSAAVDPSEAAAVGAMGSFWGPDHKDAAPPAGPLVQEPGSPPTPERSKRRPTYEGRPSFDSRPSFASGESRQNDTRSNAAIPGYDSRPSYASAELRPPPLKQSQNARQQQDNVGPDSAAATTEVATQPVPEPTEPPSQKKEHVGLGVDMPGAFAQSPAGPSPLATPGETPASPPAETPAVEEQKPTSEQATSEEEHDAYRPGLGPMIKKRPGGAAEKFKKAAFAANAFKPRPGGAAERILKAKAEREGDGDDGVSGFVPRPQAAQEPQAKEEKKATPPASPKPEEAPKVEVSSPPHAVEATEGLRDMDGAEGVQLRDASPKMLHPPASPEAKEPEPDLVDERLARQPQVKVKPRSIHQEKHLADLGIERSLLENRGLEFESMLEDFGWKNDVYEPGQLGAIELDLRQELGRVEAGSWLSHTDAAREERVAHVEGLLDRAIAECDELEGLLTIYGVELGSLSEDVAYIEAQSQGLQVQSANQKLLHTELTGLVDTMSLSREVMEGLRYGDLSTPNGLEDVEAGLTKLYMAMVTMDPSIRSNAGSSRPKSRLGLEGGGEVSRMAALQEKKGMYEREAKSFCQRAMQQLDYMFTTALSNAKQQSLKPSGGAIACLNKDAFVLARTGLWMYSPLILFVKEINPPAWQTVMRLYYSHAKPLYQDSFKQNIDNRKRTVRKPTGEESELLFTSVEKEGGESSGAGLSSTARKLTVKRSQTLAKTLRNASGDKPGSPTESRAGSLMPCEVFAFAMDEMAPLISQEQNFVVDFFHASTVEGGDFVDAVSAAQPDNRRGTTLLQARPQDPDREMALRVTSVVGEIFEFFPPSISALLDWALASDPLQGVGVLAAICRHSFYLSGSSQEFLLQLLDQLATRLTTLWAKFVDEQVRAIEETKVKISKRKGVLRFIKVFPHFSAGVENVFASVARADYDGPAPSVAQVRYLVDDAYARINRAMFDSLKVIAKESPTAGAPVHTAGHTGTRIPGMDRAEEQADKAMLNYHVLMIENMHHYVEEVDDGGREGVLKEWRGRAMRERGEALEAYVVRVVRRPLGRLTDFIESVENELASHRSNPSKVASQSLYSRKAAREHFKKGDAKEIRAGIFELLKRVEKHFAGSDEESISRPLIAMVYKECERSYERVLERMEGLIREVWPPGVEGEKEVVTAFSREDLRSGFGGRR